MTTPAPTARCVDLPGGRTLRIRPIRVDDVDGLGTLYEALSEEDRYRRFFSYYRPDRGFFERMTTVADRGGFGLVAEVDGLVVGEAGYTRRDDGDGELEITVAREWRGWLGAYLFDALLEAAAARGVPNLRADVLAANRPMLALARARGYATAGRPDWSVVSVLIGTSGPTPSWPAGGDRPRVLAEVPGGTWHAEESLRAAGFDVLVCPGPDARRGHCPALDGAACPLAAAADAVVVVPRPGDARWRELVEAHARLHPGIPVVVHEPGQPAVATILALVPRPARAGDHPPTRADT